MGIIHVSGCHGVLCLDCNGEMALRYSRDAVVISQAIVFIISVMYKCFREFTQTSCVIFFMCLCLLLLVNSRTSSLIHFHLILSSPMSNKKLLSYVFCVAHLDLWVWPHNPFFFFNWESFSLWKLFCKFFFHLTLIWFFF